MNVRFFGGYKSEYVSIPKHNPIGLYFCADTRELFLGDRLLSDGLRVVPTFADLPSISEHKAAEGVIYFVEDTKNGYVLPRGGAEWLQVIYAPTTGTNVEVDLSGYYTKAEVDEAILKAIADIEFEVDLTDYAKKTDIPSLNGYATKEFVTQKIAEAELADKDVDLSAYYTKSEVDALIPEVPTKVSELENDAGYLTSEDIPETDLSNYYNKTETENFVTETVSRIKYPAELYIVDFNAPNYAEAVAAYNSGKLLLLTNAAPDTNSYAIMNYVSEKYITFTKFLTSRSEAYGLFNTYYLSPANTWEVSKEVRLNKVEANVTDEPTAKLASLRVGKEVYKLPDLANYVTNETLEQNYITQEEIANTYVTEEHISNTYITVQQAADTYVTTQEVTEVVTNEVNTVVTEQIETKVTEVIQEKVDAGEIAVKAESVSYDTW